MGLAGPFLPALQAGRFTLHALTPRNAQVEQRLAEDDEVRRWTFYPVGLSGEALARRVRRSQHNAATGRGQRYVITSGSTAVGTAGLAVTRTGAVDVFYALLPSGRGRGAASASVRAMSAWAIARGADRVQASVLQGNSSSERVLQAAGFRCIGRALDERDGAQLRVWSLPIGVRRLPNP